MTAKLQCLPDEDLATRCREELPHGLASFNELVRRYEHIVFGTCLRILQNPQDAEEASQDGGVFLCNQQPIKGVRHAY